MLFVAGCGRIGFDPLGGAPDARSGQEGPAIDSTGGCMTAIIADDFDTPTAGAWGAGVSTGTITITPTSTALQFTAAVGTSADTRGGFRQTQLTDFAETCAIAELTVAPADGSVCLPPPRRTDQVHRDPRTCRPLGVAFVRRSHHQHGGMLPFVLGMTQFLRLRDTGGLFFADAGPSASSFPTMLGAVGTAFVDSSPSQLESAARTIKRRSAGG